MYYERFTKNRIICIVSVSISKLDNVSSSVSNYAGGESVGASWTDKIMDLKSNVPTSKENEGVDEDEWVRLIVMTILLFFVIKNKHTFHHRAIFVIKVSDIIFF
jgi:hypothetical protein